MFTMSQIAGRFSKVQLAGHPYPISRIELSLPTTPARASARSPTPTISTSTGPKPSILKVWLSVRYFTELVVPSNLTYVLTVEIRDSCCVGMFEGNHPQLLEYSFHPAKWLATITFTRATVTSVTSPMVSPYASFKFSVFLPQLTSFLGQQLE
jgi:hypothetical protein